MTKRNISCLLKEDCCGCGACVQICPKHCIEMKTDVEGFLYPVVDENQCISCGVCAAHCPILERDEQQHLPEKAEKAFVIQDKNEHSLNFSTSGGAFACLARKVLSEGGVVFGAAYNEDLTVSHIAVETEAELRRLQGSKYVVSHLGDSFSQAKSMLIAGRKVLFSGTACQIAGLKSFLGKDFDMLVTVDIVCHGTPSQKIFKKYIEWLGRKNGGKVDWYEFRAKRFAGWDLVGAFGIQNKTKLINPYCDPYYAAFLRGDSYRMSCYSCRFANLNRPADFTIGDFWGFYELNASVDFDYKKGMSLLLPNTSKAERLMPLIEQCANVIPVAVEKACAGNGNLYHPTKYKSIRKTIYEHIDEPFESLQKNYLYHESKVGFYVRRLRRRLLSQKTRDMLKKLLGK